MNKYLKTILIPIISIISTSILLSILNLLKIDIPRIIYLILIIIITFITGIIISKKYPTKSFIKSILFSLNLITIFTLLSFIIDKQLTIYNLIYNLIIVLSTTLGSIITKIKS